MVAHDTAVKNGSRFLVLNVMELNQQAIWLDSS